MRTVCQKTACFSSALAQLPGSFAPAGNMTTSQSRHTAVGVVDGQLVGDVRPITELPLGNNEREVQQKRGEVLYAGGVPGSVAGLLPSETCVSLRMPWIPALRSRSRSSSISHRTAPQVTISLR